MTLRLRSGSDGDRNIVNMTAPEPLKGYEPKLTYLLYLGHKTDQLFMVTGSKIKVTETVKAYRLTTTPTATSYRDC